MKVKFIVLLSVFLAATCLAATVPSGFTDNLILTDNNRGTTMTVDPVSGDVFYVLMFESNILKWDGNTQTTFLSDPVGSTLWGMDIDGNDFYFGDDAGNIWMTDLNGSTPTLFTSGLNDRAMAVLLNCNGEFMIASTSSSTYRIDSNGTATLAFSGAGSLTSAACTTDDRILLTDSSNSIIELTPPSSQSTFASGLSSPTAISVHAGTGNIYVATEGNGSIAQLDPSGTLLNASFATGIGWDSGYNPTPMQFSNDFARLYYHDTNYQLRFIEGFGSVSSTAEPVPVPVMSVWGLVILISLLGTIGFRRRRMR
jgi:DNA-binding beta-propeller fold protein YncE